MHSHDVNQVVAVEASTLSPWSEQVIHAHLLQAANFAFVAKDTSAGRTSAIVGWYAVQTVYPEAELLKVAVTKERRGEGIGYILLSHLCDHLGGEGFSTLFLEVRSSNHTALKLYLKNGFVKIGQRDSYYRNPSEDALILQKKLDNVLNKPHCHK